MQGFIILANIGTEKLIVTNVDGRTEIRTPMSHPCDEKILLLHKVSAKG